MPADPTSLEAATVETRSIRYGTAVQLLRESGERGSIRHLLERRNQGYEPVVQLNDDGTYDLHLRKEWGGIFSQGGVLNEEVLVEEQRIPESYRDGMEDSL